MTRHGKKLISVIMPCFNAAEHISHSVNSALSQSYKTVEVVTVDDGSTDNTFSVLQSIAERDHRVRLITQPNQGPAVARNRGLREASGQYIAFLDADDYWSNSFLEKLELALTTGGVDLAYSGWQNVGAPNGRDKPFVPPDYACVDRAELLLGGNRWPIHAALTRREIFDELGTFDERLTSCMDYEFWLRVAPFCEIVRVPEVLAFYRHHSATQITKNRLRLALNHWQAQKTFLASHPDIARRLGSQRVRDLTYGELLRRAYSCYWDRDLQTARAIFRRVMRGGYGRVSDWKYMLPALLPIDVHRLLVQLADRRKTVTE